MEPASPFSHGPSPLFLAAGSTPYRHPLIVGRAVAVYFALQPPTFWKPHAYPWLKIALHLGLSDCELSWTDNGTLRQVRLRGKHVCFFAPNETHSLNWRSEAPIVWIFVDSDYLRQIGREGMQGVVCVELSRLVRSDLSIFRLADLFHEACLEDSTSVPLYVEAKGTLLATRLLRAQFGPAVSPARHGGLNLVALQKVQDYLQSKLTVPEGRSRHLLAVASRKDLSNAALARIAGLSEHHFIRLFKERMKKTPQVYVMQCRLDKAEELIVAQHYSPKEAAYAAGFCEPGHFYRRFRQRYGRSPHELLRQSRP